MQFEPQLCAARALTPRLLHLATEEFEFRLCGVRAALRQFLAVRGVFGAGLRVAFAAPGEDEGDERRDTSDRAAKRRQPVEDVMPLLGDAVDAPNEDRLAVGRVHDASL